MNSLPFLANDFGVVGIRDARDAALFWCRSCRSKQFRTFVARSLLRFGFDFVIDCVDEECVDISRRCDPVVAPD